MTPEVRDVPTQHVAFVSGTCKHTEIGDALGPLFGRVMEALAKIDVDPGQPFARWTHWRESDCDLDAGLLLAASCSPPDVEVGTLGGRAACATHVGHYDGLQAAHRELGAWVEAQGLTPAGSPWEIYVTDPCEEEDTSKWRTDLFWPVS